MSWTPHFNFLQMRQTFINYTFKRQNLCILHKTGSTLPHTSQLRLLGDGFEGLQYQVSLVDKPVGTDKDVYCPADEKEKRQCSGYQLAHHFSLRNALSWKICKTDVCLKHEHCTLKKHPSLSACLLSIFEVCFQRITEAFGVLHKLLLLVFKCLGKRRRIYLHIRFNFSKKKKIIIKKVLIWLLEEFSSKLSSTDSICGIIFIMQKSDSCLIIFIKKRSYSEAFTIDVMGGNFWMV